MVAWCSLYRARRDGSSSLEWPQPCKNQTALQLHHSGGYSKRAVKGYSHSFRVRVQELCGSRGGRPGLPVLMSLTVSADVEQH